MALGAAHKQPLRGFSGLIVTSMAASCRQTKTVSGGVLSSARLDARHTLRNTSSLAARVLNAFHDLHASMTTSCLPVAFLPTLAFLAGTGSSAAALRFFGAMLFPFFGSSGEGGKRPRCRELTNNLVHCYASRRHLCGTTERGVTGDGPPPARPSCPHTIRSSAALAACFEGARGKKRHTCQRRAAPCRSD